MAAVAGWVLLLGVTGGAVLAVASPSPASAAVVLGGSSWFGGAGVPVCYPSNGACPGVTPVGGVANAPWQCVELAQRFYKAMGWYSGVFPGVGYAYQIYDKAGSLGFQAHSNGTYAPVAGDLIIENPAAGNGNAGHVAVVDYVSGGSISAVEENASSTGRHTYSLSGLTVGGGYAPIRGIVHSPANRSGGGGVGDGSFVRTPDGAVFRIAGGAPLYVSNWANIGGPQPFVDVADLSRFRTTPVDGYFIRGLPGGQVYRVAGGAPLYVSSWANIGGPQNFLDVDQGAIDNAGAGGVYNHLNAKPVDGTSLVGLPGGTSYRVSAGVAVPLHSHPAGIGVDQEAIRNAGGGGVWSHLAKGGSGFHGLVPMRLLDSRSTLGGWNSTLVAGEPRSLTVTGGVVPASATAVVANVTVTNGSANSYLTVYPAGAAQPNASNINFGARQTIGNLVTVKVGVAGRVAFATAAGAVDVVVDVVGWYDDGTVPGDAFHVTNPTRVLDSRAATGGWGARLVAGVPRDLKVTGAVVPVTATAVAMNLTVTNPDAGSYVQVWPAGAARPGTSSINFGAGQTVSNLLVVPIGAGGALSLANAVGSTDVVADVVGYFDVADGTGGARFHALAPTRILDDRRGVGVSGPWNAGQTRAFGVAGSTVVPAGATGVVCNVAVTGGTAAGYITAFADLTPRPDASSLNFGPGQTVANLAVIKVGANGKVSIFNAAGTVDVIADAAGYFAST